MFRQLAAQVPNGAQLLVKLHPAELTGLLEQAWNLRTHPAPGTAAPSTGHPDHRSDIPGLGIAQLPLPVLTPPSLTGATPGPAAPFTNALTSVLTVEPPGIRGVRWPHWSYAYMIENTRIRPIFRRVVHELLHGEKLGVPREDSQLWLRNTEELFFRDPSPFSITTINSYVRRDLEATERNGFQRMFGMELNHGSDDNSPYPYTKAEAANNEFVTTFEELLREVWVGHINRTTTSGANPTDDSKIEELAHKLHDMLITRRLNGNLSREEFFFVSMMSWFHLTVESNLPIIADLRADGTSPEQRLFKIAQLVGLPAHGLARSYFEIADSLSALLIAIETGALHVPGAARAFYDPTPPNSLDSAMNTIITHWSIITGHDVKAGKVAVR
jgi:hypothetical protein